MPNSSKKSNVTLRTLNDEMRAATRNPDFDPELPEPLLCIRTLEEARPNSDNSPSIAFAIKRGKHLKFFTINCNDLAGQSQALNELIWREPELGKFKINSGARTLQKILTENSEKRVLLLRGEGLHKVDRKSKIVAEILVVANRAYLISGSCPMTVHIENPAVAMDVATTDEWNDGIGKHLDDNPRMLLSVLVALAPTLASLLDRKPPAVVLVGPSSIGKSTLLRAASSIYLQNSTLATMSGTDLGLREAAANNPGKASIFDEVSSADNASVLIDMLFDAEGQAVRHRSTAGSPLPQKTSNADVTLLFANEMGVAELLGQHTRSGTQGTWARVLEVHPSKKHGMFNTIPEGLQAYEFAEALKKSAARCGGALWQPWLEYIGTNAQASRPQWEKRLDEIVEDMRHELAPKDSIQQRLIHSAAIWVLTGELAVDAGLLSIKQKTSFKAVKHLLRLHFTRIAPGAESQSLIREIVKVVGKLRDKIKDWPVAGSNPMPHHARKYAYGSMSLFILPIALEDVLGRGEKRTNTLEALKKAGLLKCPQKGWSSQFSWPGSKTSRPRFYVFDEQILSYE